jgi:hypothetical protein
VSYVTGVFFSCSLVDLDDDEDNNSALAGKINNWLRERKFGPLKRVDHESGGSKHPQRGMFVGGYNYFPDEEFAAFLTAMEWECPEDFMLYLAQENGGHKLFQL